MYKLIIINKNFIKISEKIKQIFPKVFVMSLATIISIFIVFILHVVVMGAERSTGEENCYSCRCEKCYQGFLKNLQSQEQDTEFGWNLEIHIREPKNFIKKYAIEQMEQLLLRLFKKKCEIPKHTQGVDWNPNTNQDILQDMIHKSWLIQKIKAELGNRILDTDQDILQDAIHKLQEQDKEFKPRSIQKIKAKLKNQSPDTDQVISQDTICDMNQDETQSLQEKWDSFVEIFFKSRKILNSDFKTLNKIFLFTPINVLYFLKEIFSKLITFKQNLIFSKILNSIFLTSYEKTECLAILKIIISNLDIACSFEDLCLHNYTQFSCLPPEEKEIVKQNFKLCSFKGIRGIFCQIPDFYFLKSFQKIKLFNLKYFIEFLNYKLLCH
ncbi:MAG: hypothetical protein LBJ32_04855 [Oscillospiraceae bacterium]|jgi:hypothetical protein|nr:hypothetical protein [Oscillospiraceae bacterium]